MNEQILEKLEQIKEFTLIGAKHLLSPNEAALYMGVNVQYIYKLMRERKVTYNKPNGRAYIDKSELDAFMSKGRIVSDEALMKEVDKMSEKMRNELNGKKGKK